MGLSRTALIAELLLGAAVVLASPASANTISYYTTVYGTDFSAAGTGGLRGTGTGTITVSGLTGTVNSSVLFWAGPTNSTDPNVNANVTVNGTNITGSNIGFSQDNYWGYDNSQAYRADTSSVINGNGTYNLTNFNKPNAGAEVNGAGAFLFSDDGNAANNRDVVVYDGNDANFASPYDPAGWNFSLNGINYSGGSAFLTLMVSDGQNFGSDDDGYLTINGVTLAYGGIFQGDTLPGGLGDGTGDNGNLWDIETFDITSFLSLGSNNLNIQLSDGFNDALGAIAAAIDLPAGAAPPPPGAPEPITLTLFGAGLAGIGAVRRRKRR